MSKPHAKKPKSLRTAFIRVYGENKTKSSEIIKYSLNDIRNTLEDWLKTTDFNYWLVKHFNDENDDDKREHYHFVIKFKNPTPFTVIKNRFPYGDIETAKDVKNCVQYLVHKNDKSKKQYDRKDVLTNNIEQLNKYLDTPEINLKKYLLKIEKGDIREFNQFQEIPFEIWVKHKRVIENAHIYYKQKIFQNKDRQIQNDFIFGDTGTGKTTFIKDYCKLNNLSLCISSSSNDPFQDYKGEDILLLDDLRDDVFRFHDLLKILDNHTKSTSQSRYNNKFFLGKKIIITTTIPLDSWYSFQDKLSRIQLYRRIQNYYKFSKSIINRYVFNEKTQKYETNRQYENPYSEKFKDRIPDNLLDSMNFQELDITGFIEQKTLEKDALTIYNEFTELDL